MTTWGKVMLAAGLVVAASVAGAGPAAALDEILLTTGDRLLGEVAESELTLHTTHGTYRVDRRQAWRVELGMIAGDAVDLRNGNRISGRIEQASYTIRLANGETVVLGRGSVALLTWGARGAGGGARDTDVMILNTGDHVYGEITEAEFDLVLEDGTHRFGRAALWRIDLRTVNGDTVDFHNGNRLSGRVDRARYAIRTPDGQLLTYGREEIDLLTLRPPAPVRPAAAPPAAPAAPAPAAPAAPAPPQVAAVPPPALPAPLRAALRDIYFSFDRWDLSPDARRTLEEVAAAMKAFPDFRLLIEGHADERGTPEYNLALGERRAQAARDYLVNLGVDPKRLDIISYGEERPLDPGHNELAWALNRRAHFTVAPR